MNVSITIHDHTGAQIDVVRRPFDVSWSEDLAAPGSGEFSVAAQDVTAAIAPGNRCRIFVDGVARASMVIDSIETNVVGSGEDADRTVQVQGRGGISVLDEAVVYPSALGAQERRERLISGNPGAILATLVNEAKARGALADVTLDFSGSAQTGSGAWPTSYSYLATHGTSLLTVIEDFAIAGWAEVWLTPAGQLRARVRRGTDKTSSVVLWPGRHLASQVIQRGGPLRSAVLWAWDEEVGASVDSTAVTAFGRRETFKTIPMAANPATRDQLILALRNLAKTPDGAVTVQVVPGPGVTPYVDFDLGDDVKAAGPSGAMESLRVISMAASERDGRLEFVPTLGTLRDRLEEAIARRIRQLERETYNPAPTLPPAPPGAFLPDPDRPGDIDLGDLIDVPGGPSLEDLTDLINDLIGGVTEPASLISSTDFGQTWQGIETPAAELFDGTWEAVGVDDAGAVVIVGRVSQGSQVGQRQSWKSLDGGASWMQGSSFPFTVFRGGIQGVEWFPSPGVWVIFGADRIWTSGDGLVWNVRLMNVDGIVPQDTDVPWWDGSQLVMCVSHSGSGSTPRTPRIVSSSDGASWSEITTDIPEEFHSGIGGNLPWRNGRIGLNNDGTWHLVQARPRSSAPHKYRRSTNLTNWTEYEPAFRTVGGGRMRRLPGGLVLNGVEVMFAPNGQDLEGLDQTTFGGARWVQSDLYHNLVVAFGGITRTTTLGTNPSTDAIRFPSAYLQATNIARGPDDRIWVAGKAITS